ncbi:HAD family hydrolase [Paenibacillus rhizovicinus]|uniref:HAD family hydrolase n=1 Tax=Paenibacillus rhizovicinus TaxID=2704463 RepID=A0A6C0P0L8_9BACL|nr:HAD family hydrolase [Paenibacillus rhizovicinus]QHW31766.1 HAD family hydrolase [Paenibacillus rhizovicinus]
MRGIVLDLDGTLLNSEKQVSERNLKALLACRQQGMRVVIATGRPPRSVRMLLPSELLEDASFVYYNGALVVDPGAGIESHTPIEPETAGEIIDYCSERLPGEIMIRLESSDRSYAIRAIRSSTFYSRGNQPTLCTTEEMKQCTATKILLSEFGDAGQRLQLQEAFAAKTRFIETDGGRLIQVMNASVSKASGIMTLCEHYGIRASELFVFGDDYNDLEMFGISAHAVAMGNAVDELKALAVEVTDTNDNDGVAKVLERWLV